MQQRLIWFSCVILAGMFLLTSGILAQTYKEEGRIPEDIWSGYWWPTAKGEILGPLSKYDQLTGAKSAEWEKKHHPARVNGRAVPDWNGLCHGWAASCVLEKEPNKSVLSNNVTLTVGDQKGWLAVCHGDDVANFYGRRYNGPSDDLADLSPEDLWKVLRTHIKDQGIPVILDLEPKEQIWNYPVYAYRVEYTPQGGKFRVLSG